MPRDLVSPHGSCYRPSMPRTSPPRKDKNRVPRAKRELPAAAPKEAERIAKVIARAGLGSRREIEEWITAGRVSVNGEVLASPAFTVTAEDEIRVDGEPLPERERTRLFLYHKPIGVVTTNRDPEGRTTLFELLPGHLPRLVSVGRLDINSEGLLLLTNDGGLARVLELPETGWLRRYRVRAKGTVDQAQLDALIKGIVVEGVEYGPIEAVLDRVQGANVWITVALREGKNREVRNVLGALGLQVNRLIRISYGPFQLGEIAEGGVEEVRTRILRDQIGNDIAAAAGADFNGPLVEREPEEEAPRRPLGLDKRKLPRAAEVADAKAAVSKPARRERRSAEPEIDPERPPRVPLRKRMQDEERKVVKVGTVADRKGRAVKVERKLAPVTEEAVERRPRRKADDGRAFDAPRGRSRRPDFEAEAEAPRGRRPAGERPTRSRRTEEAESIGFAQAAEGPRARRAPRGEGFADRKPSDRKGGERAFGDRKGADRRSERPEGREKDVYPFRDRIERSSWRADDAGPKRRSRDEGAERPARGGFDKPRRDRDDARPFGGDKRRSDRPFGKPEGGRGRREQPAEDVGFGGSFEGRPPRGRGGFAKDGGSERPARFGFDKPRGERRTDKPFGRPEGGRTRREQPAGEGGFEGRAPRGRGGFAKEGASERPARSGFDKPRGERSFGKSEGRPPREDRSPGGKPAGKRPGFGAGPRTGAPKGRPGGGKGGPARGGKPQGPRSRG
ncbi:pseudouridine synthase [Azorhizobium caulinodans]|nr:pseudouridine synthase [Azorhizobium caulinodans]